jgi:hypothetical protein
VYLLTPLELAGHLYSSLHRLLMHLWPLALFTFFLGVATPEEALARRPPRPDAESAVAPQPEPAKMKWEI